ncbi:adenine phosphoribosyltransferase [Lishizhenia tianjinensis]|uniref:Adenine phosphoribosyltransferase n=1 Tax=Lishizhenia tianjinensis TaxID=477690 RepID=A0A1I7BLQ3_9FLAO|nr:adenine phosphoribosyltransferase [Lishizhenia tianjinensis]SFT88123.1 adenine phosphoribosyltransferase [Lishizhenia tianjinensis]
MNIDLVEKVKAEIRDVVDFPKEGIVFKDITPIMLDPQLSNEIVEHLATQYKDSGITKIAGIESRGFLFGYPLAMRLGIPFILIRKKGKLPYKKVSYSYDLEYGSATIEMHEDAVDANDKVLVHDDLLATGGSAEAAAHLIKKCGASVEAFNFLVSLDFLEGDQKLKQFTDNIQAIVNY